MKNLQIKVYVDEDISQLLAKILRDKGLDAISALEVNMKEKLDEQHLAYAKQEKRILITCNRVDFVKLAKIYGHAGMILCKQLNKNVYHALANKIVEEIIKLEDWSNVIIWV